MQQHPTVSPDEWLAARTELLEKEKEFTRLRDKLSAERRALPWVKVEKDYVFDGPGGKQNLADLFGGASQRIVEEFMFGPGRSEGAGGRSVDRDHAQSILHHPGRHDVSPVQVSRGAQAEIEAVE